MLKQRYVLMGLIALVIILSLGIINYTGYAVTTSDDFSVAVIRYPVLKNGTTGMTHVSLRIISEQNVLLIKEVFSDDFCVVLNYSLDKNIDIFEFDSNVNAWIVGNRSNLNVVLDYDISVDCDIDGLAGVVYTLEGNQTEIIIEPTGNSTVNKSGGVGGGNTGGSNAGGSSGSGSSGGSGGASNVVSQNVASIPIVQAKDDADFNRLISSAANRLAGITDESQKLEKGNFYTFLGLIVAGVFILGVIIFFIFLKRPKDFERKRVSKSDNLVDYIKKYKGNYPLDQLKKVIISSGYTEKEFNDALKKI